ncbi:YicC family protein [Candidatus Aerophobetes bacterium]|uniref:YicC family protein n=1 Tax=Aerophobetes bacterium TaxID=2030807 RepID=A0A662DAV4_UNCAE|nr:MAG: YicC family protein [Candidatus Aerophobetes bacterium]
MTGYGEKLVRGEGTDIFVQIKTLNHRFFQIDIFPSEDIPWSWEKKIEEKIKKKIHRGKVLVNLKISKKENKSLKIKPNFDLAASYLKGLKELQKKLNIKEQIKLSHLLSIPGILRSEEEQEENIETMIQEGIDRALEQVIKTRQREGEKHLENILKYVKKIKTSIKYIEMEIPSAQKKYREKIREEIGNLLSEENYSISPNQIASKLSLVINKGDIEEEIVRFNSHLTQLNKTLKQKGPIGKKLGFILQELQREVTTIGAKSLSFSISEQVVKIKDNLEKIREQVYNIE